MNIIRVPRHRQPLTLAISLALAAGGAHAATISVTSHLDDNGSGCTLREAIQAITDGMEENGCSNSSGSGFGANDIIDTTALSTATITLGMGHLTVSGLAAPLTIEGSGETIDANGASRVLYVGTATLTLDSLTLTGGGGEGRGGGAYVTHGTLTLNDSAISENLGTSGAGLWGYYATLTLTNSTISGNYAGFYGGGIGVSHSALTINGGTVSGNTVTPVMGSNPPSYSGSGGGIAAFANFAVVLNHTTVSGNSAQYGAGVLSANSPLTLTATTVSGNTAVGVSGGALGGGVDVHRGTLTLTDSTFSDNYALDLGGALYAYEGTQKVTNSTFSGNTVVETGGGIFARSSTLTVTDSTISGNAATFFIGGGGISIYTGTVALSNTILAGNSAGMGPPDLLYFVASSSASGTYNLLGTALNNYTAFNASGFHNIFVDTPGLDALADNGGPTLTMALATDSPARDAGNPDLAMIEPASGAPPGFDQTGTPLVYDQRGVGFPRTLDGNIDIGAFEHQPDDRIFVSEFESGP